MSTHRKIFAVVILIALAACLVPYPKPAQAVGLPFGGTITSSRARICNIPPASPYFVPVPVQEIGVTRGTTYNTYIYVYYAFILQLFGVTSTLYNWYNFYTEGPSVLGQYIPVPYIPWDCYDLTPANIITKMGTSPF